MTLEAHRTRHVFPKNLYDPPDYPHHVHLAGCSPHCTDDHDHVPVCVDHRVESCPDEHWIGGHPEVEHPHHVEYDGETGRWGYTRLSDEELADLQQLWAYETEVRERAEKDARSKEAARRAILRARAKDDPAFKALLEQLGIPEK